MLLQLGFVDVSLLKLRVDFKLLEDDTPAGLMKGVGEIGQRVLIDARSKFVAYGSGAPPFVVSAQNMKAGVVTGQTGAISSVGQTLPRAEIISRRRPEWSDLQYNEALSPALDQNEPEMGEHLENTMQRELNRFGFTP